MHGMRHSRTAPAGRSLLLLSLLALLAFTCFPVFAQADSSGAQYEVNPVPEGGGHHHQHEPVAKSSTNNSGGTPSAPAGSEGAPTEVNSGGVPSEAVKAESDSRPERHQGSPEGGQGSGGKQAAPSPAPSPAPKPSSDGGNSPLVPILIALAALAAISVGVFLVRQRRQDSGGLTTPPAG
jgi:hypothetical protein